MNKRCCWCCFYTWCSFKPHTTSIKFSPLLIIFCGNMSLFVNYTMLMRPKLSKTAVCDCYNLYPLLFTVDLSGNARYKRDLGAHFIGFKLAINTHVLSKLDFLSFKPYPTSSALLLLLNIFCGNVSLSVSYAMLMRPEKAETANRGCYHSLLLLIFCGNRVSLLAMPCWWGLKRLKPLSIYGCYGFLLCSTETQFHPSISRIGPILAS